ncbi:MAG: hypothetical protein SPE90_05195, partial [Prevotella sp.]|nr:hypothetical protein [Prevotella sp.]
GQKRLYKRLHDNAFAPSGRTSSLHHTQGDALGYVLVAPSGRALNACAYSLIQLAAKLKRNLNSVTSNYLEFDE